MILSKLKKNIAQTRQENSFLKMLAAGLVVINGVLVVGMISQDPVNTIVPPTMTEQGWVDSNSASDEYTEAWALYVATVVGNVNPSTASMIRATLEPLLDNSIYQDVVNAVEEQVNQIRQDRVVIKFEPKEVLRERENLNKFFVVGRSVMTGPNGRPKRSNITYEIEMSIRNYKPTITFLTTYSGRPKTEDVIRREKASEDAKARMEKNHEGK